MSPALFSLAGQIGTEAPGLARKVGCATVGEWWPVLTERRCGNFLAGGEGGSCLLAIHGRLDTPAFVQSEKIRRKLLAQVTS